MNYIELTSEIGKISSGSGNLATTNAKVNEVDGAMFVLDTGASANVLFASEVDKFCFRNKVTIEEIRLHNFGTAKYEVSCEILGVVYNFFIFEHNFLADFGFDQQITGLLGLPILEEFTLDLKNDKLCF